MHKGDRVQVKMSGADKYATVITDIGSDTVWVHIDGNRNPQRIKKSRVIGLAPDHVGQRINRRTE